MLLAVEIAPVIATSVTFEEKNGWTAGNYGMCALMKPGPNITAGNLGPRAFGRDG